MCLPKRRGKTVELLWKLFFADIAGAVEQPRRGEGKAYDSNVFLILLIRRAAMEDEEEEGRDQNLQNRKDGQVFAALDKARRIRARKK